MSVTSSVNPHRRADDRRSTSRRGAHMRRHLADGGQHGDLHVTPNVVVVTRGAWDFGMVKRFAQWLTDGATDRPHLRF